MKEKKDYQRTIRMTQTTRNFLEQTEGNGLNEKFENLVYNAYLKEKELVERNESLERTNKRLIEEIEKKSEVLHEKLADIGMYIDRIVN